MVRQIPSDVIVKTGCEDIVVIHFSPTVGRIYLCTVIRIVFTFDGLMDVGRFDSRVGNEQSGDIADNYRIFVLLGEYACFLVVWDHILRKHERRTISAVSLMINAPFTLQLPIEPSNLSKLLATIHRKTYSIECVQIAEDRHREGR
jgi:hypothetical protein